MQYCNNNISWQHMRTYYGLYNMIGRASRVVLAVLALDIESLSSILKSDPWQSPYP